MSHEINLGTWAPSRFIVTVAGERVTGFGDDDMVSLTYDSDKYTKTTGVVDEVGRAHTKINGGVFVFSLLQTSKANDYFNKLMYNDHQTADGSGIFPISMHDLNGTTFLIGAKAWLKNYPDSEWAQSMKMRQWSIDTANVEGVTGGNASNTPLITGSININL